MTREQEPVLWEGGGFRVTRAGLSLVTGEPTLEQWSVAVQTISLARSSTSWALGDLLLHAESRRWDDDAVEAVMDATGLKRGTLLNLRTVSRAFPLGRRRPELPWSHHALVSALDEEDGDAVLASALAQSWGWAEVREHAQEARRRVRRREMAFPQGTFGLLVAEPPWHTTDRRPEVEADEVAALAPRVQAVTAPDAVLYLHATNQQLEDALTVMRAWGFRPVGNHVVVAAEALRNAAFTRERHWLVLIGTRGRFVGPESPPDSVLHSHQSLTRMLEELYEGVPRVLLFAQSDVPGWVTWDRGREEQAPGRAITVRPEEVVPA